MKKFLRYVFTIALFGAMCFGGYKYITDWGKPDPNLLPDLEASIVTSEDNLVGTFKTTDDLFDGSSVTINDSVVEIFNSFSGNIPETLICNGETFGDEFNVYMANDETANVLLKITSEKQPWIGNEWTNPSYSSIQDARDNAKALIEGLSQKRETSDGYRYIFLIFEDGCHAFGNTLYQEDEEAYLGNLSDYLQKEDLKLKVENAKTLSVLVMEPALITEQVGTHYALVECDLTCIENLGRFNNCSWIPNMGESKRTRFIICFSSVDKPRAELSRKFIGLFDIQVLSQE